MNEYLIKYEAPPISEITKTKTIEAKDIRMALITFEAEVQGEFEIFSIELI